MNRCPRRILTGLLITLVIGCSSPTGPEASLAEAQQRWIASGLRDYSWVVFRSCECLPEMSGPTRVVVREGEVESRWYLAGGEPTAGEYAVLFPSVDDLFALISQHREQGTPIVDASYDPVLGYPVHVVFGSPHPDGVVVYQTSDFTAGLD
jgi:hypothetical protein